MKDYDEIKKVAEENSKKKQKIEDVLINSFNVILEQPQKEAGKIWEYDTTHKIFKRDMLQMECNLSDCEPITSLTIYKRYDGAILKGFYDKYKDMMYGSIILPAKYQDESKNDKVKALFKVLEEKEQQLYNDWIDSLVDFAWDYFMEHIEDYTRFPMATKVVTPSVTLFDCMKPNTKDRFLNIDNPQPFLGYKYSNSIIEKFGNEFAPVIFPKETSTTCIREITSERYKSKFKATFSRPGVEHADAMYSPYITVQIELMETDDKDLAKCLEAGKTLDKNNNNSVYGNFLKSLDNAEWLLYYKTPVCYIDVNEQYIDYVLERANQEFDGKISFSKVLMNTRVRCIALS
jgi:hypothetical protein